MSRNHFSFLYFFLAVLLLLIVSCRNDTAESTSATDIKIPPISLHYFFTAEMTFQNIFINDSQLSYSYFDPRTKECTPFRQAPCWTEQDILTTVRELSPEERRTLSAVIDASGFLDLEQEEEPEGKRFYTYLLSVILGNQSKEIRYYADNDPSNPMPESFAAVRDTLFELI